MKILVTGGSGLVGSQFKSDKYKRISSKDLNLLDQKSIKEYLELNKDVDSIIHCAARVGGVKANMEYPAEFTYENLKMNTGIIEEAKNAGIKNLVCFSSTCVFPDKVEYPLTEKKIHLGLPHFSNDAYAYAKRMADIQIRAYREQYGLNYKSVIPTKTVNAPKPAVAKTVDSPKGPYNVFTNPDRMSPIREQQEITEYYRQVLIQRLDEEEKKLITGSAARASLPSKGKLSTILISSISEIVPKYELISANNGAFSNG